VCGFKKPDISCDIKQDPINWSMIDKAKQDGDNLMTEKL